MNLLIASNQAEVSSSFEVSVGPSFYFNQVNNGAFTTPAFTAFTSNEVGEVSYDWSIEDLSPGGLVEILNQTSSTTRLSVSGVNTDVTFVLRCTAADDGGDTSSSANIFLFFGEAL